MPTPSKNRPYQGVGMTPMNKGCFLFLLDQSYSMGEPIGDSKIRKCDQLAMSINSWLEHFVLVSSRGEDRYWDAFDVGVLGYRTDRDGNPVVASAFHAPLNRDDLTTIPELAKHANFVEME